MEVRIGQYDVELDLGYCDTSSARVEVDGGYASWDGTIEDTIRVSEKISTDQLRNVTTSDFMDIYVDCLDDYQRESVLEQLGDRQRETVDEWVKDTIAAGHSVQSIIRAVADVIDASTNPVVVIPYTGES